MRYPLPLASLALSLCALALFSADVMADPRHSGGRHYQARPQPAHVVARPAPVYAHRPPMRHSAPRHNVRTSVSFYYGVQPGYTVVYPTVAYPGVIYPVYYAPYAVAPAAPVPVPVPALPEGAVIVPAPEGVIIDEQSVTESDQVAARIIGTIVGGVIGHQFGNGSGKTAATIGGAVVGGLIGDQLTK